VLDGHYQVDIDLLKMDANILPEVDKKTIMSAYPDADFRTNLLDFWGLNGNGPWRVVLAGYITTSDTLLSNVTHMNRNFNAIISIGFILFYFPPINIPLSVPHPPC